MNKCDALRVFEQLGINVKDFSLKGKEFFARVVDVYDGDTLTLIIPIESSFYKYPIRLMGIDTCEMKSKNQENKTKAICARNTVLRWILQSEDFSLDEQFTRKQIQDMLSKQVSLVWVKCNDFEKFGRLLCNVYLDASDSESLSQKLINEKLAYAYTGGTKLNDEQQMVGYTVCKTI